MGTVGGWGTRVRTEVLGVLAVTCLPEPDDKFPGNRPHLQLVEEAGPKPRSPWQSGRPQSSDWPCPRPAGGLVRRTPGRLRAHPLSEPQPEQVSLGNVTVHLGGAYAGWWAPGGLQTRAGLELLKPVALGTDGGALPAPAPGRGRAGSAAQAPPNPGLPWSPTPQSRPLGTAPGPSPPCRPPFRVAQARAQKVPLSAFRPPPHLRPRSLLQPPEPLHQSGPLHVQCPPPGTLFPPSALLLRSLLRWCRRLGCHSQTAPPLLGHLAAGAGPSPAGASA